MNITITIDTEILGRLHPTEPDRCEVIARIAVFADSDAIPPIDFEKQLLQPARVKLLVASSMQPMADYVRRPNAP